MLLHPDTVANNARRLIQPSTPVSWAALRPGELRVDPKPTAKYADPISGVAKGKLKMPVLAIGGDHSYGAHLATEIGFAAADVRPAVIEDSGHWIMEEQPEQAVTIILTFLKGE